MTWDWEQVAPFFAELAERPLNAATVDAWLADWTSLMDLMDEWHSRLHVATTVNTENALARAALHDFLDNIDPPFKAADQRLKQKLLASGLRPTGFDQPLRDLAAQAEIFREENLPIKARLEKLGNQYDEIIGAQSVDWDGESLTLAQVEALLEDPDRNKRERAWRATMERRLQDRDPINRLWTQLVDGRLELAKNAGMNSFIEYQWKDLERFDYTPADCARFRDAIAEVVVPAVGRMRERRRAALGVDKLRPWDTYVDVHGDRPLKPFDDVPGLADGVGRMFASLDGRVAEYYEIMRAERLLDLDNRPRKAPGGYCTSFAMAKRPFIFMNAVGTHDDVQTLLHESGHCFHVFQGNHLPYYQQHNVPIEFAEVASMAMELLAAPFLHKDRGGFYDDADAARARLQHLEHVLSLWPFMAVVDGFQHWAYKYSEAARHPEECDATWERLWDQFAVGVDWGEFDEAKRTGWHRKLHIFLHPFYYVEYGLAQLGAVQVWRNATHDRHAAIEQYLAALALGGTQPLPRLFEAAGARFAFDADTLREAVDLVEEAMADLEKVLAQS
ncbi:MAG: M3 family oligoendopeptidase [Deltaproteobacteria bacterium]|nr:M3 family oligoendopeptidase [Deltaproteobacteria bacterium]